jgi:O-acetyl-ADP-ribose deacetylase (regulator of RNase III)
MAEQIQQTGKLTIVRGDAAAPHGDGNKLIVHCCNNVGAWGAGFVLSLSKKWPQVEARYKSMFKMRKFMYLGYVQYIKVSDGITVANLIGQHSVGWHAHTPPIVYQAIEIGLYDIAQHASERGYSVHCPKFGSDLAGGNWNHIEDMLRHIVCRRNVHVTVYEWAA